MQSWSDLIKTLSVLFLGWLLGLLAPAIVEAIRRKRRTKLLELAFAQELHEMQYQMALKAYVLHGRAGKLDDAFLLWFEEIASNYKGVDPVRPFLDGLPILRKIDVSQRGRIDPKRGLALSESEARLLGIHINEIALFSISSQAWLLQVAKQQSLFNQQVAYLRRLFEKTFDNLTDHNRSVIQQNVEEGYGTLAQRAILIADVIKTAPSALRHR